MPTFTIKELRLALKALGFTGPTMTFPREGAVDERGLELRYASISYPLTENGEYMLQKDRRALTKRLFAALRQMGFDRPNEWIFEEKFLYIFAYVETKKETK